jgi:hypothetical protein
MSVLQGVTAFVAYAHEKGLSIMPDPPEVQNICRTLAKTCMRVIGPSDPARRLFADFPEYPWASPDSCRQLRSKSMFSSSPQMFSQMVATGEKRFLRMDTEDTPGELKCPTRGVDPCLPYDFPVVQCS